ncbi:MAG TPA: nitrogenase component 1 [Myxococcota bacterium]|nr:nitrogenase component 1 [Myxococcota bacterium]HQK52339.1 nitrogenase component 1 [Myxococcota bacterium]
MHGNLEATQAPEELGSRIRVGDSTRDLVAWRLGLETAPEDWRVRWVVYYDDHFEVLLGPAGSVRMVLVLEDGQRREKAWVRTPRLAISYRGETRIPEEIDQRVRSHAPARMGESSEEDLLTIARSDPGTRPLPVISTGSDDQVTNLLTTWAGDDAFAEFFAVGEIARSQLDSIDLSGSFRFVQHCDNECMTVSPHGVAPLLSAVEYPWENRQRSLDLPGQASRVDPSVEGMVTTDLSESDVIMGNPDKVRRVLDYVVAHPLPDKITFFSNTCVPMVTGEDVESVVRRYAARSPTPLVYLTVTPISMFNVFRDLLETRRLAVEARVPPPTGPVVNLVGYAEDATTQGVRDLLQGAGITVNTHLIPDFAIARIERLPLAPVSVFYPNRVWRNHYTHLTGNTRIRCVTPDAPYGFRGSHRWLREVCQALDLPPEQADAAHEGIARPLLPEWERLVSEARQYRIALVVRAEETEHLTDPSTTWGVPLLAFLEEAGFGLDILIKVRQRKQARESAQAIVRRMEHPDRHVVKGFHDFETLRQRLRESEAQAALSYHYFDWRLSEAGKNRFSLQVFEMGLPGAIRSVRRLLNICRTPFYRRYRDYLARSPEGVPLGPGGLDGRG